jgi:hypothetical protein
MPQWTAWRKIADRQGWYGDLLDWNGPACYELAIAGSREGALRIVYVGETSNEKRRVIAYAARGAHLSEIINWHIRDGWCLFYRAQAMTSKEGVAQMQNNLLARWQYDWNIQLNGGRG